LFFAVFLLFPTVAIFGLSFTHWSGYNVSQLTWAGLDNFHQFIHDPVVPTALVHTLLFVVLTTVGLNVVGLGLALFVNAKLFGHELLRIAVFIPLGLSPVVSGVIFQRLVGPSGFVNEALQAAHIIDRPIDFFQNAHLAFATIVMVTVWQFSGVNMLLYYAGLQSLPTEQLEAAQIDGARFWQQVRHVVIPYLRPVAAVAIVLNLIGGWKVFDIVYVLTRGGPARGTEVLGTYLYEQAFTYSLVGYGAVIAITILLCALLSSLVGRGIRGEVA